MNEEQTEPKKKKQRIGNTETAVLLFFAILFDVFSLIPYVNIVIVIVSQSLIALFFYFHGVNVLSKKRAIPYILAWLVEAIPAISMFPAITLETLIIIALTRIEDRTGIDPTKLKGGVVVGSGPGKLASGIKRPPISGINPPQLQTRPITNSISREAALVNLKQLEETNKQISLHRQEEVGLRQKGKFVTTEKGGVNYQFGDLKK